MIFGAIDVGTNAARMLVGQICKTDDKLFMKKISYTRIPLRLGEDVFEIGGISKKREGAFIKTMKSFKLISEIFDVQNLRAVSTSAMREANNSKSIISKIKDSTGIELEVISGDEEAALILGAFEMLNIEKSKPYLVIDVGGGSTEISIFKNGERLNAKSFQVGTIRLLKGKVQKSSWDSMEHWINKNVGLSHDCHVFGTGGNINKIHKLIGANNEDSIRYDALKDFYQTLKNLSLEQRITKYKLKPDRADVIVPALEIYLFSLKKIEAKQLSVPKIGLSDGVIYNFYKNRKNGS